MFTPDKPQNYFLSQVHQPFFVSGIFFAVIVMLMFMLGYKGILPLQVDAVLFHSYTLFYIVFTQFFTGFIFTTFPRFCQSEVIPKSYYIKSWSLVQIGSVIVLLGAVSTSILFYIGMIVLLLAYITIVYALWRIYAQSDLSVRHDPKWILSGFMMGLFGHLLYLYAFSSGAFNPAPFVLNLFLVYTAFSVAQRMVPFFSHVMPGASVSFAPIVFFALVAKVVTAYLGFDLLSGMVSVVLGLYMLKEIVGWKLPFTSSPAILKILHISLYWLIAAFILGGIVSILEGLFTLNFMALETHMLALGFVTTILVGFGTRVTLGHSGQPPHADTTTLKIFYLLQVVVIVRMLFSIIMGLDINMFWMFDLSITMWLLLFLVWGYRFAPVLIKGKKL